MKITSWGLKGILPRLSWKVWHLGWQLCCGQVRGPVGEHLLPLSPDLHHLLPTHSILYRTSLRMSLGKCASAPDWWPWRFSGCAATHIQSTDSSAQWQDRGQDSRAKKRLLTAFWNKKVGSFTLQLTIDMKWVPKFKVDLCIFKNNSMLIFVRYSTAILMTKLFVITSWNTGLSVFTSGVPEVWVTKPRHISLLEHGHALPCSRCPRCPTDASNGGRWRVRIHSSKRSI